MSDLRLHITGASCSGTTTLGRALSEALGVVHLDTDDYYFYPTDPPYTTKRPPSERLAQMQAAAGQGGWVISGALEGWGEPLLERVDLIIFLTAPTAVRLARLKARERRRFGTRIAPGGDMEHVHANFLVWAAQYDETGFTGRSRVRHETWLEDQQVPILRLNGTRPVARLAADVLARVEKIGYAAREHRGN